MIHRSEGRKSPPRLPVFLLVLTAVLLTCTDTIGADWYVAVEGDDASSGTLETPLATIARAATMARAGDTIYLRGGVYREQVYLKSLAGTAEHPITFRAYPLEQVEFDGTEILDGSWKQRDDGIHQARLKQDLWQLFDGRKPLDLARWPDASLQDGSVWDAQRCMRSTDRVWNHRTQSFEGGTRPGVIVDRNHAGHSGDSNTRTLAETGIDFAGAVAVLNTGHWLTWARPVLSHRAGSNRFTYDAAGTEMRQQVNYYLYGLPALDQDHEWWYQTDTRTLSVKLPDHRQPEDLDLRGKVRDYNLLLEDCAHLRFFDIHFFATTFGISNSHHILVEGSRLLYPSTHKFVLGSYGWVKRTPSRPADNSMTYVYNDGDGPFGNVIRHCTMAYPNSPAIGLYSPGLIFDHCEVHHVEWDVNSSGGSGALPGGAHTTVRQSTLHTTGNSEGIRLGPGSTIEGNRVFHTSLLQHDGSAINVGTQAQQGTVVRHNWVYRTHRQGIRLDSTSRAFGKDAAVWRNVIFDIGAGETGSKFKGDYHLVAGNTAFDGLIGIPTRFGDTVDHNHHSLVCNNLTDYLVEWNLRNRRDGIPAKRDHNVTGEGSVRRLLRDPDNFDFRPRADASVLVDAGRVVRREELPGRHIRLPEQAFVGEAPDIGAYEFGALDYWIPGAAQWTASAPVPPDGSHTVKSNADLMWKPGREALSHTVYFGSDGEAMQATTGFTHNVFHPGPLMPGQSYTWRVDAVASNGTCHPGDPWSFTVKE